MLLKEWRWKSGMTQKFMADSLGCSQSEISRIEGGGPIGERMQYQLKELVGPAAGKIDELNMKSAPKTATKTKKKGA